MRVFFVVCWFALSSAGCIRSEERAMLDADTSSDAVEGDVDTSEPDGSSADGSGGETVVACDDDDDCAALGPCWELTSAPVCDPSSGCPATPRPEGWACGEATTPTCEGGWAVPVPSCSGAGECVDHAAEVPTGIHPLAGSWFFVTSSTTQGSMPHTARALLTLGGTLGTWTAVNVLSTSLDYAAHFDTSVEAGDYCLGLAGDVTLSHGDRAWDGFVDESVNVMVFAGASGDELAVAVRASFDLSTLDGEYAWVGTAWGPGAETIPSFVTYHGGIRLKAGCIESGSETATLPGLGPALELKGGFCFGAEDGVLVLDGEARVADSGEVVAYRLVGAAAMNGDMLLVTREAGEIRYGTTLLVRQGAPMPRSPEGRWRFVSQRGGLGPLGPGAVAQVLEDGWLRLGPGQAIAGEVFGFFLVSDVVGGWWSSSTSPPRYSHRASFGDVLMHHTGYAVPGGTFVVAMGTAAPSDAATPTVLPPLVGEGSLFVMVRPASFAPGWVDGD